MKGIRRVTVTALAALPLAVPALMSCSAAAIAGTCPNEQFRVGASASLPDCRAYELVTPEHLGSSQDMTFEGNVTDKAVPERDGERLALATPSRIEPEPALSTSIDVFSRTPRGWEIKSAVAPGAGADNLELQLLSPDFSLVGLSAYTGRLVPSPTTLELGPVGGPYARVAEVPSSEEGYEAALVGANAGTASVPAFSDVLVASNDPALASPGTKPNGPGPEELYDWSEGQLRPVAVSDEGKPLGCGSQLGSEKLSLQKDNEQEDRNAVSADGSKIFFTSCGNLYMRVDGRETVEISAPQGVQLQPSERRPISYLDATESGSKVFFSTDALLTPDAPASGGPDIYEYETEARAGERLRFIATWPRNEDPGKFVISKDGSIVYYEQLNTGELRRVNTITGENTEVSDGAESASSKEPIYTTPNGEFLAFTSTSVTNEPRTKEEGAVFRYDNATKSVICVACGESEAGLASYAGRYPEENASTVPLDGFGPAGKGFLETGNEASPLVYMSENGQEVFFQTSAKLVPQDTNSTDYDFSEIRGAPGMDVYEWEAEGWAGCKSRFGCTHLLSGGDNYGASIFLGATRDGSNVFFSSPSPLLSWATPEFTNIYDARVDGGFAPPSPPRECLSCQGVGSTAPLFGPGASLTFVGPGNAASMSGAESGAPSGKKAVVKCRRGKKRRGDRCVKRGRRRAKARKARKSRRVRS